MKKIILLILCIITLGWMACDDENCYPIACEIQPPTDELCLAYFENWFYDTNTNACELIGYSGCNPRGFETQAECETCICNPEPPTSALDGDWHLVSIVCLCPPVELGMGESVWTFDAANDQLVVVNNVSTEGNMLESGTYEVVVDEANNTISDIFGILCNYELQDDDETLSIACEVEVDGPWYRLVKGN